MLENMLGKKLRTGRHKKKERKKRKEKGRQTDGQTDRDTIVLAMAYLY